MTTVHRWTKIASVATAVGVMLFVAVTLLAVNYIPLRIGDRAPDFSAMTLAGTAGTGRHAATVRKSLADYHGEVVLLNIWATWCGPCRIEMPSLQRLQERLGPAGLRIVAVSVDVGGMESRIVDFGRELGLTFELLHDAPGAIQRAYQSTGVPETYVIGRDGRVRRRIIGADDWSSAAHVAFLERLLAESAP